MRWLVALLLASLAACATKLGKDGRTETDIHVKYLAKTEVDRIADTNRQEVVEGLLLVADKLYKRNPKEWRKGGAASREAALDRLRQRALRSWPEFNGLREGQISTLAFSEAYTGDRVMALVYGLLTMVDAAFDYKDAFYIIDSLDERKLFNCARNMEVAIWKLGHDLNTTGALFLLSNELDPANRNLSFEREFGRIMGLLDFMAQIVADRNGRGLSRLTHSVISTVFLPVGFLK